MARFLVDASLPRSIAGELVNIAHEAVHVINIGLKGASDDRVHPDALARSSILLTADLGFGDILRCPPQFGTVIIRIRNGFHEPSFALA